MAYHKNQSLPPCEALEQALAYVEACSGACIGACIEV